jgi:translation initiation factor IF-1
MGRGQTEVVVGVVREVLPGDRYRVELADRRCIEAECSGKIRVRFEDIEAGDSVRCELSPIAPGRARIVERIKGARK